jgi:hypothetical protein
MLETDSIVQRHLHDVYLFQTDAACFDTIVRSGEELARFQVLGCDNAISLCFVAMMKPRSSSLESVPLPMMPI